MIPAHARAVNAMPYDVVEFILDYFQARRPRRRERGWLPSVSLAELGIGQADVVMALLDANHPRMTRCAEWLIGRPITRCPPCLRPLGPPIGLGDVRSPDERRITFVEQNPRLPTTGAFYRYAIFRVGMTVQSFLMRGGQRRDVRVAQRRGWIQLSEPTSVGSPARRH